jgi:hypothetical protein
MVKTIFCSNCGNRFTSQANFCSSCGTKLSENSPNPSGEPISSTAKREAVFWKSIQVVIAILILVNLFIFVNSSGKEKPQATIPATTLQDWECFTEGEITANGQSICVQGKWYPNKVEATPEPLNGRWEKNCVNVKVPNPNYDARKGYSAFVNEPYLNQEQCSQAYVYD